MDCALVLIVLHSELHLLALWPRCYNKPLPPLPSHLSPAWPPICGDNYIRIGGAGLPRSAAGNAKYVPVPFRHCRQTRAHCHNYVNRISLIRQKRISIKLNFLCKLYCKSKRRSQIKQIEYVNFSSYTFTDRRCFKYLE